MKFKSKLILHGLLAGIVMDIVMLMLNPIMNILWPSLQKAYENTDIFRPWDDPLMMLFFLYPIILGIILAYIWDFTKGLRKEKNPWKNGACLGFMWAIFTIPGMFINYSSFQISLGMVFSWWVLGLIQYIFGGMVITHMNKK